MNLLGLGAPERRGPVEVILACRPPRDRLEIARAVGDAARVRPVADGMDLGLALGEDPPDLVLVDVGLVRGLSPKGLIRRLAGWRRRRPVRVVALVLSGDRLPARIARRIAAVVHWPADEPWLRAALGLGPRRAPEASPAARRGAVPVAARAPRVHARPA